ncbi:MULTISPECIES: hypothetical protein [Methylobacterium]|nr:MULTISPECIES: hypothetical protein [Methylobacterium]
MNTDMRRIADTPSRPASKELVGVDDAHREQKNARCPRDPNRAPRFAA